MQKKGYEFLLPEDFDDEALILESKGWARVVLALDIGLKYSLTFIDPARLSQDVDDELISQGYYFESNLVVVSAITRQNIETVVVKIIESKIYEAMKHEP